MSEQPQGPDTADQSDPPPARDSPVAGGADDGPPAQGDGEPHSY